MEDITYADHMHSKEFAMNLIKNLGEYHDCYFRNYTLLLVDVFENCKEMCLELYHLDSAKFLSAPGLS